MSGSSMDGMDVVYAEIVDTAGAWEYQIHAAHCYPLDDFWETKLRALENMGTREYAQLDVKFGAWMGNRIADFIQTYGLEHKVHFVGSHGHTAFHDPENGWTAQIGHGGAIAAAAQLPVISDLRQMDVSLGGQGAPIVPIAEKLLMADYPMFLNLGGIANISIHSPDGIQAYDITACNRVLDMLSQQSGQAYDKDGGMAREGRVNSDVLQRMSEPEYLQQSPPKSLHNEFGTQVLFPMLEGLPTQDALATMTEHIATMIASSLRDQNAAEGKILITGGGAHNGFLVERIAEKIAALGITAVVPDARTVDYKEALAMCMMAVLRWREEANVLAGYSGASRDSIGGALWTV